MGRTRVLVVALFAVMFGADGVQGQIEREKLLPDDGDVEDRFGSYVALEGTTAVVGAHGDEDNGDGAGAAYVLDITTGEQLFKLTPDDGSAFDQFGQNVSLSGSWAVLGARRNDEKGADAGAAYVFDVTTGEQLHKLTPVDAAAGDEFGFAVSASGNIAVVGAYGNDDKGPASGSAYVFDLRFGVQADKLVASDGASGDVFGQAVALDGNLAIIGAEGDDSERGAAYLFDVNTSTELLKIIPEDRGDNDRFGDAVDIYGDVAIVGALYDDDQGSNSGSAYLFDVNTGEQLWKLLPRDGGANDIFGHTVAIHKSRAIVGAAGNDEKGTDTGAFYVFDVDTGQQLAKLSTTDSEGGDEFGLGVALSSYIDPVTNIEKIAALVGARLDDVNGSNSGSAYFFDIVPKGDMDGNGVLDSFDVNDFEMALADPILYRVTHPGFDGVDLGDFSLEGDLDAFDVPLFEAALAGNLAVPEPTSLALLALGGLMLMRRNGRFAA